LPVSKEVLDEIALSQKEYDMIVQQLGREPTEVELGLFGALWSEHCGYKHSKALLKKFPSSGKYVIVKPGEENAGVIDIGDGIQVAFKMESHNHPSAIEPYQGAATGVGGIVRDIFTMGARPIALTNSLRFGPLTNQRNKYLMNGVVGGIAGYGNCLGIPDVGGELLFADCYSGNPLVNALCLGIIRDRKLTKAIASGEGNILMVVGADTGRDGLHGASGLASRTFEEQRELRSTVQVGNPFMEKLLIEACLELGKTDWIVGIQDCGAAGLTSSAIESAYKGNSGIEIDVLKVSRREQGMTPYEVMLSESQERMLVVVKKGYEDKVKALFDKWGLHSDIIGKVTNDKIVRIKEGTETVAEVPIHLLMTPPVYILRTKKPKWLDDLQSFDINSVPDISTGKIGTTLLKLLSSPNICSKHTIYRQYDHQVGNNSVVTPGSDAAVLRIQGTKKAIALTNDGNGRYCYVNPYVGGAITIAEASRNLVCSGAQPMAITNCLNFGDPDKKDVYYQLKECVLGMSRVCREFKIPVISGNVSLYNETRGVAIYPTPVIGMVGLIENVEKHCTQSFKNQGDIVVLLGEINPGDSSIAASEYLNLVHGIVKGNISIDINMEKQLQKCCLESIKKGILNSAHDCSDGGLLVTLAECCFGNGLGFESKNWPITGRLDSTFFGEAQSRIIVSTSPRKLSKLENIAQKWQVPFVILGTVGGKKMVIKDYLNISLNKLSEAWLHGLDNKHA
jgi:phosphoribosylformylglycinamidine synthase II